MALNVPDALTSIQSRLFPVAVFSNIANAAGSGAGASVVVAITNVDQFGVGRLPGNFAVVVSPSQSCFASVSNKSTSGFTITLTPLTSSATLAAGSTDAILLA